MKKYNEFLLEKRLRVNRLPKDLYVKLQDIAYKVKDYISGAKSEEVEFEDLDELILYFWDESVELNDENKKRAREMIGSVDDIKPGY